MGFRLERVLIPRAAWAVTDAMARETAQNYGAEKLDLVAVRVASSWISLLNGPEDFLSKHFARAAVDAVAPHAFTHPLEATALRILELYGALSAGDDLEIRREVSAYSEGTPEWERNYHARVVSRFVATTLR